MKTDLPFLSLGRLLSNHVVVRKGFNVVKRLPSADLVALHTECLTFVISKIAGFESQEKKASRSRALAMFKALVLCLAGVNGKEAAKIQAHLSSELRENAVTPVATAKAWEPYRSYEKRLFTLMSKDSSECPTNCTGRRGRDYADRAIFICCYNIFRYQSRSSEADWTYWQSQVRCRRIRWRRWK